MRFCGIAAILVSLSMGAPEATAIPINIPGPQFGAANWGPGGPNNIAWGQSFMLPIDPGDFDNQLDSISFYLGRGSTEFDFKAYVYEWDSSQVGIGNPLGNLLYESAATAAPNGAGVQMSFGSIGVPITQGVEYIAIFSGEGLGGTATDGLTNWDDSGTYTDGAWYQLTGTFASGTWSLNPLDPSFDLQFDASFSFVEPAPVPEASHVLLAALGGLALFGFARRRLFAAA